jgi:hypothetical protein
MSALRRLTIENFRGSVGAFSLVFDKDTNLTIIYGENGTGKSTICDAFELLSAGKVGSLENRGLGQTLRYWPSMGKSYGDVSITLETTDATCRATVGRGGEVIAFPEDARPRAEVFRQSRILSLVEAKPGERYAAISRFIDVSAIEASEGALREQLRDVSRRRDLAAARVEENAETIRHFWETEGRQGENPFDWAENECARETGAFEAEIVALNGLQAAYARLAELPDRLRFAQQAVKSASESAAAAEKAAEECLKSVSGDAREVVAILQAAAAHLARHPSPDTCPLCESSEKTGGLLERIRRRLTGFSALEAAQAKVAAAGQVLQRAEQQFQLMRDAARQDVAKFEEYRGELAWPKDVSMPGLPVPGSLAGLTDWLAATAAFPPEWKKAEAARHDKRQFIHTLKQALKTWRDNLAEQTTLERLLPRLERALHVVEEERRRFSDEILETIAEEVGRLHDHIHPGEGLNDIRLELDPKKRASLEIGAAFCGRNTRPQAYFSGAHLDTLGLCIFLALAALDHPENTILILDDVLAGVDDSHMDRVFDMLLSEAGRFQHCIITTTYRPWQDKLRRGLFKNHKFQFVELAPWMFSQGLAVEENSARTDIS